MKLRPIFLLLFVASGAIAFAADNLISRTQAELKKQGFYYGEVTGNEDADTAAAIKRFQIRNALEVTGELNQETLEALGLKPAADAPIPLEKPAPAETKPAPPAPTQKRPPANLRKDESFGESDARFLEKHVRKPAPTDPSVIRPPSQIEAPPTPGTEAFAELFERTPYNNAPLEVQQGTLRKAQSLMAREGYYREVIDGAPGPHTEEAILLYQRRHTLPLTGRLDTRTLQSMDLLPGRNGIQLKPFHAPSRERSSREVYRGVWVE